MGMTSATYRGPRQPLSPLLRLLALALSALLLAAAAAGAAHAGRRPLRVLSPLAPAFLRPCRLCLGSRPTASSIAIAEGRQRASPVAAIWASARGGEGGGGEGGDDKAPLQPLAVKGPPHGLERRVDEQAAVVIMLKRQVDTMEDRVDTLKDAQMNRDPDELAARWALEDRVQALERQAKDEAAARKDLKRRLETLESKALKRIDGYRLMDQERPEPSLIDNLWKETKSFIEFFWFPMLMLMIAPPFFTLILFETKLFVRLWYMVNGGPGDLPS